VGVLIHEVVPISDLPLEAGLVVHGQHFQEVEPLHVGLKSDNVLHVLLIVGTKQNLAVVLVLHVHLHRGLNDASHSDAVRLVVLAQTVDHVAVVVGGGEVLGGGAEHTRLRHSPVAARAVSVTLNLETVVDLDLEHFNGRLLDGKVSHLNVKSMELDTLDRLVDSLGKSTLADLLDSLFVGNSAILMELAEKIVEVNNGAGVFQEPGPVAAHTAS